MVFRSPYGATSIEPMPSVQACIILPRDKDLSWDKGISWDIPRIRGIRDVNPIISTSLIRLQRKRTMGPTVQARLRITDIVRYGTVRYSKVRYRAVL
jgi:hypothetical protein